MSRTSQRAAAQASSADKPVDNDDLTATLQGYCYRDDWIAGVLSDVELSPTARMVGAYLGLAVDLNHWPSIPFAAVGASCRILASRLGLPIPVAIKACDALMERDWLRDEAVQPQSYCYTLSAGVRS